MRRHFLSTAHHLFYIINTSHISLLYRSSTYAVTDVHGHFNVALALTFRVSRSFSFSFAFDTSDCTVLDRRLLSRRCFSLRVSC